jgi:hypothetical protein
MPRPNTLILAARDLCDDVAYHGLNLVHGAFDLTCVVALGLFVFATGQAETSPPPSPALQITSSLVAPPAMSCTQTADATQPECITSLVLTPLDA